MLITILIIHLLYKANLFLPSISPITRVLYYLVDFIFVNDLEFHIMNQGEETIQMILERVQKSIK